MQFHKLVSRGLIWAEIMFEWCWDTPWFLSLSCPLFFMCATRCKPCWCKRWRGLLTEAEHACIAVGSAQLISCESRVKDEGLCYQFNSLGLFVPAFVNQLMLYLAPLIKLRLCSALCKGSNNLDSNLYLSRSDGICALCVCVCADSLHISEYFCPVGTHLGR